MAFTLVQNDTSPAITATLTADGTAVDLSGATVKFQMTNRANETKVNASATVTDATAGTVSYQWQTGDTDTTGWFRGRWEVTFSDGTIRSFPAPGTTQIHIVYDYV